MTNLIDVKIDELDTYDIFDEKSIDEVIEYFIKEKESYKNVDKIYYKISYYSGDSEYIELWVRRPKTIEEEKLRLEREKVIMANKERNQLLQEEKERRTLKLLLEKYGHDE